MQKRSSCLLQSLGVYSVLRGGKALQRLKSGCLCKGKFPAATSGGEMSTFDIVPVGAAATLKRLSWDFGTVLLSAVRRRG